LDRLKGEPEPELTAQLQLELSRVKAEREAAIRDSQAKQVEITAHVEQLHSLESQLNDLRREHKTESDARALQLQKKQGELEATQARLHSLDSQLGELELNGERNGGHRSPLDRLKAFGNELKRRQASEQTALAEVATLKKQLTSRVTALNSQIVKLEKRAAQIPAFEAKIAALRKDAKTESDALRNRIATLEREIAALKDLAVVLEQLRTTLSVESTDELMEVIAALRGNEGARTVARFRRSDAVLTLVRQHFEISETEDILTQMTPTWYVWRLRKQLYFTCLIVLLCSIFIAH
jgi:chromosome segregation ATPase